MGEKRPFRFPLRWFVLLPVLFNTSLIMGWLLWAVSRPDCRLVIRCTQDKIMLATGLLLLSGLLWGTLLSEQRARAVRQVTAVLRRIGAGDRQARILPQTSDEIGDLIRAVNQMSETLNENLDTLTQEKRELEIVLDNMADGVLIADAAGLVQLVNPAACRLLETTINVASGRLLAEVVRQHQIIELWQRCRESGQEQVAAIEIGRDLFWQVVITPFQEKEAAVYLVIVQDLTRIRRLETVRRDFISNLSHELRTPLASLRAVVDTLQGGALEEPEAAHRFLERANVEVDTLTQMVEELLELSRIESGQVPLRLQATAVSDLFLPAVTRLEPIAQRHDVEIILNCGPRLPFVLVDADRIQQVLGNLVHNAIKFTPAGGKVTLAAIHDRSKGEVQFEVKDNGVGIAARDLPRIFERFYKSDRARTRSSQGGTGLGLAIARHIVQIHNGRIWAKSKEGKGSTFYFTLPVAE